MSDGGHKIFRSVMVIDDSQMDRYVAELMLIKTGIAEDIIMHEDASQALQEIKEGVLPELILLDVNMPRTNGFDFLKEFDKFPEHTKDLVFIYMLTSSMHNEDRSVLTSYPYVRGILNKPLTPDSLREVTDLI